jgi:pimeloyl-ACP methyl ester carboxylesterase
MAMAPAIEVSVGYPPDAPPTRNDDLTHTATTMLDGVTTFGGGGGAFAAFLAEDLAPFIAKHSAADLGRAVLVGHSLGGLFAANVFAERPDAFAGYVIGSPSVWADGTVVARVEKAAAKARSARVFMGVGSHEDLFALPRKTTPMLTGFACLEAAFRRGPRVTLAAQVYPGEGHVSVYSRMLLDAFPFMLPPRNPLTKPTPPMPDKAVGRMMGDYAFADGRKISLSRPGNGLVMAQLADQPPAALLYEGGRRFYSPVADVQVDVDQTGFTVSAPGATAVRAERA